MIRFAMDFVVLILCLAVEITANKLSIIKFNPVENILHSENDNGFIEILYNDACLFNRATNSSDHGPRLNGMQLMVLKGKLHLFTAFIFCVLLILKFT
jgi:hypothetical protein